MNNNRLLNGRKGSDAVTVNDSEIERDEATDLAGGCDDAGFRSFFATRDCFEMR